jgi:PKD repeat protein
MKPFCFFICLITLTGKLLAQCPVNGGVIPKFSFVIDNDSCKSIVTFSDSSKSLLVEDSITSWLWDFGDGTESKSSQNPVHKFWDNGKFTVKLFSQTKLGCVDSITNSVKILGPAPSFQIDDGFFEHDDTLLICVGDSLILKNYSIGNINPIFYMNWGDGDIDTFNSSPTFFRHKYRTTGIHNIDLKLEDSLTVSNSYCKWSYPSDNPNLLIDVKRAVNPFSRPQVSLTVSTNPTYVNHPTEFKGSLDKKYTRLVWDFGDEEPKIRQNVPDTTVIYKFKKQGTYQVVLSPEYDVPPRCWAKDTVLIEVKHDSLNSVRKLDSQVKLYPNPSMGLIYIQLSDKLKWNGIKVFSTLGKEHAVSYYTMSDNILSLNITDATNGYYTLIIETNMGVVYKSVAILK